MYRQVNKFLQVYLYMSPKKVICESATMRFLKKIRDDRGLTQYGMAKYLGMLTNTYIHYEEKAKGIKLETLVSIRKKLGLTWAKLGQLIEEEVEKEVD